jgi:hypothetical protein
MVIWELIQVIGGFVSARFEGLSTLIGSICSSERPPIRQFQQLQKRPSRGYLSQGCVTKLAWLRGGLISGGKAALAPRRDELEQDIVVTFAVSTTKPSLRACMNSCSANDLMGTKIRCGGIALIRFPISAPAPVSRASYRFSTPTVHISSWIATVEWPTCRCAIGSSGICGDQILHLIDVDAGVEQEALPAIRFTLTEARRRLAALALFCGSNRAQRRAASTSISPVQKPSFNSGSTLPRDALNASAKSSSSATVASANSIRSVSVSMAVCRLVA